MKMQIITYYDECLLLDYFKILFKFMEGQIRLY